MLVECKRLLKDEKDLQAAADQAHSYALWVVPAYYVITDGRIVSVWDFQGGRRSRQGGTEGESGRTGRKL